MSAKVREWLVPVRIEKVCDVLVRAKTAEEAEKLAADCQWNDEDPGDVIDCRVDGEARLNE